MKKTSVKIGSRNADRTPSAIPSEPQKRVSRPMRIA